MKNDVSSLTMSSNPRKIHETRTRTIIRLALSVEESVMMILVSFASAFTTRYHLVLLGCESLNVLDAMKLLERFWVNNYISVGQSGCTCIMEISFLFITAAYPLRRYEG